MSIKKGFTLVELLVVMTIISLLAAILLPVLSSTMEIARRISCLNNQKQLYLACSLYGEVNEDKVPPECRDMKDNQLLLDWFRGDIFKELEVPKQSYDCPSEKTNTVPRFGHGNGNDGSWGLDGNDINLLMAFSYLGNYYGTRATGSREKDWTRRPTSFCNPKDVSKALWSDKVQNHWKVEFVAEGSNEVFMDGHGKWIKEFPLPLNENNFDVAHDAYNTAFWWW